MFRKTTTFGIVLGVWMSLVSFVPDAQGQPSPTAPPNPGLVKLPFAFSGKRMENTPVIFKGRPLLVQDLAPPGAEITGDGAYLFIDDLVTGQEIARFAPRFCFVSAFVHGDEMNIFATVNTNKEWTDIYRFWSTDLKTWKQEKATAIQ